jgi:MFS family permease
VSASSEPPDQIPPRRFRVGAAARKVAIDFTPLRASRDYRLLWSAQIVSEAGHQITVVALFVQVYRLTGSAAAVGAVGLVQIVPLVLTAIGGGSIVDALDRRKLLIASQIGFALTSGILLAAALADRPPLWLIYAAAGLTAALSGIDSPVRSAMIPRLVGRDLVPAAVALNQVMWQTTAIAGPAISGVVIYRLGLPWAYGIDVATYGATLVAALLMRPMPPLREEGAEPASGWPAIRAGFRYLKGRRVLQSTFYIDLIAMIFGMPRALFPILAATQFHRPAAFGLLYAAPAAGALIGALTAGWVGAVRHQGRAVIWAVAAWGAGITAFGLVGTNLWLGLFFLAVAGAADVISAVFRSTILQVSVPDSLRGRLSGIHILVVTGGPRLGDFEAGVVAQLFDSATVSVVSGGVVCIAGAALLALLVPEFARYHAGERT